ncbi:MAG: hypothetical protein EXR77_05290 [Myxococcales bacterium]|nr:hypothetical protein [Myxococcales bacterium]
MILIDSNVFVIDLRYPRDTNAALNRSFLDAMAARHDVVTTVVNVLEVAGILSFNLAPAQVQALVATFAARYRLRVVPHLDIAMALPGPPVGDLIARIAGKMAFGDALVLAIAEAAVAADSAFVSWDAELFVGRTTLRVATPEQWLAAHT